MSCLTYTAAARTSSDSNCFCSNNKTRRVRFNASYTRRPENDIKSHPGRVLARPLQAYSETERESGGGRERRSCATRAEDSAKSIHKVVVIYDLLPFLICQQSPSEAWRTLTCISYHIVSYRTCNILLFYFNIVAEQTQGGAGTGQNMVRTVDGLSVLICHLHIIKLWRDSLTNTQRRVR